MLFTYLNTKRWDKKLSKATPTKKENKYLQSKIFSVAATTFFINLYALVLDGVAIGSKLRGEVPIDEHYIHALPYFVIAMDGLCIIFWLACWVFSLCSFIYNRNREYQGLAISTIGPTLSLVVHLPYIAIAYLNDAAYATSIFIYYTVTTFVLFGILDLTYGTCQGSIIAISNNHNQVDGGFFCCPKNKTARRCIFTFLIPLFAVIVLGFACMITAALVIVPISKAFSDVPNRLLGFYQTAVILVGAYLVYRSFFKQIPSIDLVVKKRLEHIQTNNVENDDQWQHLSKDERVIEFYSRCVEIVANHPLGIAREHRGERDATTPPPEGERARLVQSI